jgi:hypothetical protein
MSLRRMLLLMVGTLLFMLGLFYFVGHQRPLNVIITGLVSGFLMVCLLLYWIRKGVFNDRK